VAFLLGPKQLSDTSRRWAGMKRFAKESGISLDASITREMPGSSDPLSGFTAGADLTIELIQSNKKFTAIAAFDDMTAFGAIRALADNGRRVPQDCSVVGFDDIPMAALASPSLTTIRQPMQDMGVFASEAICDQLADHPSATHNDLRLVAPTLEVRQSTQPV
jgi:LacI family transcriptional regulator